jgi:hypothetical protein
MVEPGGNGLSVQPPWAYSNFQSRARKNGSDLSGPLWERLLVAAVGPVLTAGLALFVINWVTARAQSRREASETRESLAAED